MTPTPPPLAERDELLTYQQVAAILGEDYQTTRKRAQAREFPVVDLGHRTKRVRRADLDAYIASRISPARRAS